MNYLHITNLGSIFYVFNIFTEITIFINEKKNSIFNSKLFSFFKFRLFLAHSFPSSLLTNYSF